MSWPLTETKTVLWFGPHWPHPDQSSLGLPCWSGPTVCFLEGQADSKSVYEIILIALSALKTVSCVEYGVCLGIGVSSCSGGKLHLSMDPIHLFHWCLWSLGEQAVWRGTPHWPTWFFLSFSAHGLLSAFPRWPSPSGSPSLIEANPWWICP